MGEIIHLNEEEIKAELGEMVRKSVEETCGIRGKSTDKNVPGGGVGTAGQRQL